ncbi:hypothetical protein ABZ177_09960 [Streptomyces sp. NPDC006284]
MKQWAVTGDQQRQAPAALSFKCDVLWALLDSVQGAASGQEEP